MHWHFDFLNTQERRMFEVRYMFKLQNGINGYIFNKIADTVYIITAI